MTKTRIISLSVAATLMILAAVFAGFLAVGEARLPALDGCKGFSRKEHLEKCAIVAFSGGVLVGVVGNKFPWLIAVPVGVGTVWIFWEEMQWWRTQQKGLQKILDRFTQFKQKTPTAASAASDQDNPAQTLSSGQSRVVTIVRKVVLLSYSPAPSPSLTVSTVVCN